MINFTVTFQGLQDQLLSTVVTHEVPHWENQRFQLLESISLDAATLEELEEKVLNLLQSTQGKSSCLVTWGDLVTCLRAGRETSSRTTCPIGSKTAKSQCSPNNRLMQVNHPVSKMKTLPILPFLGAHLCCVLWVPHHHTLSVSCKKNLVGTGSFPPRPVPVLRVPDISSVCQVSL